MIEAEDTGQRIYGPPVLELGHGYFNATAPPTAGDDVTRGFQPDSLWYKETLPYRLWVCADNGTGIAVWREISLTDFRSTRAIFNHYADAPTTGTFSEDLLIDNLPIHTFFENGDEVRVSYRFQYAANGNNKQSIIYVESNDVFDSGAISKSGGAAFIDVAMIRSDTDTLRVHSIYHDGVDTLTSYAELTPLDFSTSLEIRFNGTTTSSAGDLTVLSAKAIFIPAAAEPIDHITFFGDGLLFGGRAMAFNP